LAADSAQEELASNGCEISPAASDRVAVLVLNWNGCEETLACLATLERQVDVDMEVIVVDNGSIDESRSRIATCYPDVVLLNTGANLGFAGGNNVGLRHIMKEGLAAYVLILNNDTLAPPRLVSSLVALAKRLGKRVVLSPVILDSKARPEVWYNGARWDPKLCAFELDSHQYDSGLGIAETQLVTGCALFASIDAFGEVGQFDERLFLMHEEADWCFRAARVGYRFFVTRSETLTHLVSVSFGGSRSPLQRYFDVRNRLYFAQWNLSKAQLARTLRLCVKALIADAFELIPWAPAPERRSSLRHWYWALRSDHGQPDDVKARAHRARQVKAELAGLLDYLARRTGDCPSHLRNAAPASRPS
jgi:GT2 family glycosyltransferase